MADRAFPALDIRFDPTPATPLLHELLYAELDAFEPLAIHEHDTGDGWRVFFRHAAQRDAARDALTASLGAHLRALEPVEVEDEDWARRSQEHLTAIRVGRLTVAPPWDVPAAAGPDDIVIIVEPSMGFGTGHHATTRLCLALLQDAGVPGRRVTDVGTGSGVLAIAAAKLGAAVVTAIDNDPDALENARGNAALSGVRLDIREADLGALDLPPADVLTANLTGAVLQRYASALHALVAPEGELIVSGFSPEELPDVAAALGAPPERDLREGDWCAARFSAFSA